MEPIMPPPCQIPNIPKIQPPKTPPGADGINHCVTGSVAVNPGATEILNVPLTRAGDDKLGGKLFGMRGYPVAAGGPGTVDARNITQLFMVRGQAILV